MAVLAYLLPPVTGLVAFLAGRESRARLHGLQAVALGLLWPAAVWTCSWISPAAAAAALVAGGVGWLALLLAAALGRTLRLPFVGRALERAAATPPRAAR